MLSGMNVKVIACLLAVLQVELHATTKEECIEYITQWDVAIEMMFTDINRIREVPINYDFLLRNGSFVVYRHDKHMTEWWEGRWIREEEKSHYSFPIDIYAVRDPHSTLQYSQLSTSHTKEEFYCRYISHETYQSLYFCCFIERENKKRGRFPDTRKKTLIPRAQPLRLFHFKSEF